MELCAPPDYNTRAPVEQLPPLSCDVHCHVFGPAEKFPYWEGRPYDAPDCPVELLWKMHATLGFERGVVVQSAMHGNDNAVLLDALRRSQGRYRGVATLGGNERDIELEALHEAGVRGVRFNFDFLAAPPTRTYSNAFYKELRRWAGMSSSMLVAKTCSKMRIFFDPSRLRSYWITWGARSLLRALSRKVFAMFSTMFLTMVGG